VLVYRLRITLPPAGGRRVPWKLSTQRNDASQGFNLDRSVRILGEPGLARAKIYFKAGRTPWHLFLASQFQNCSNSSRWLARIFFYMVNQWRGPPGRLCRLLHEVLFRAWSKLPTENIASSRLAVPGSPGISVKLATSAVQRFRTNLFTVANSHYQLS